MEFKLEDEYRQYLVLDYGITKKTIKLIEKGLNETGLIDDYDEFKYYVHDVAFRRSEIQVEKEYVESKKPLINETIGESVVYILKKLKKIDDEVIDGYERVREDEF